MVNNACASNATRTVKNKPSPSSWTVWPLPLLATRSTFWARRSSNKTSKRQRPFQTLQTFVANQHSPSEQQANILERIAKHEVAHRSPILKQTAWLSFASAVGSLCQDQPAQGQKENFRVEEICPRGKKEQYKNTLFEQFQKAENIYEQILMLKAIGNAALDNSIEDLRQIVNQQSQSTLVRMEAVDAMRRLRTSMPHKICQVLLPIFQNQREQPEIRMAAFSMIMHTLPEKSIIDQMTFTVISDRSQNVKSFVLSTMEALAQSPSSAEQQVANHLKSALKMVKINEPSRNVYSSLGIKSRRTGSYYLSTEESDEMIDEKNEKTTGNQPFGMIVIRSNDVDMGIVPINEHQLPQAIRKMIQGQQKPQLSDFEGLSQLLSSGQQFQRHGAITINEKKTKIPTTSGFPLALMRQITAVGSVEGQFKVRIRLRTSAIATHLHKAEVWSPIIITGVQTVQTAEVNGPLEAKIRSGSSMVEVSIRPPQDHKIRFFALHTLPMTYTSRFDMDTRTQRHYHEISDAAQLLQALYTTENNVHYYYVPSEQTPKELKVRVSGSMFQKHNEHSRPEMDSFYTGNKGGFQPIYEEDYEGMELEKDEQRQSRLSSYQKQYSGKNAYKHQLTVETEARYPQKTYKMVTELKGACDSQLKHCKLFVDAERSPMLSESQQWTLKAKIQTVAPEIIREEEDPSEKQSQNARQDRQ
ncbi:hypothetical protein M3Y94_00403700 [Aphelenchoides besseyi]|nr:hypothetical protein M3Y94_00403700 [Aphelenchoides besseyi]